MDIDNKGRICMYAQIFLKKTNGLYIQENKYNSIQNFERLLVWFWVILITLL